MTDLMYDDTTGALKVEDGDLVLVSDKKVLCKQAVVMTLKTYRGEWFRNIDYGTPWLANENNTLSILGKSSKVFYESQIKKAILSNPEVLEITKFSSVKDDNTGRVTIYITVLSEDGPVSLEIPA